MVNVQLDISVVDQIKELKKHSRESHNDTIAMLIKYYRSHHADNKE